VQSHILMSNIPYNCSDHELREWIESRGIETRSIRIIRDLVAGVSPAFGYVELADATVVANVIDILNGKKMRTQTISVKQAPLRSRAIDDVAICRAAG
jgi:RNA recognition motif-containing protein